MGSEADSSSPGTTLPLGYLGLSPLAAPQGTFHTMKVGELKIAFCHLTGDWTEHGREKPTWPWTLGL